MRLRTPRMGLLRRMVRSKRDEYRVLRYHLGYLGLWLTVCRDLRR